MIKMLTVLLSNDNNVEMILRLAVTIIKDLLHLRQLSIFCLVIVAVHGPCFHLPPFPFDGLDAPSSALCPSQFLHNGCAISPLFLCKLQSVADNRCGPHVRGLPME